MFQLRLRRRRGVDVLTSQEDGTRESADEELLQRADALGRVLVSQDTDLLWIAHRWQNENRRFAGVIFARQQGISIGQCAADLELIAECCREDELVNQVLFLPLD